MARNIVIPVTEPKERLNRLKELANDLTEASVQFGQYVSKFLSSKRISPQRFLKIWEKAFRNIRRGREGRQKLSHPLVGRPGLDHFHILTEKNRVIEVIFPEPFAAQLKILDRRKHEAEV